MGALYYIALGAALVLILGYLWSRFFGFMAQRPSDYADEAGEAFDLRTHLNGPLLCEGVIYGPTGRVTSRFVGEFHAEWNGNQGIMHEHFTYETGNEQHREWKLTLGNDGQIRASAPDLVGEGTGQQSGPSVQLRYRIRLPEDAGGHVLDTTDWMYLAPNGTIVNRSQFRKFGIKVAELVATMRQKEEPA
jgi:hypothetical protein